LRKIRSLPFILAVGEETTTALTGATAFAERLRGAIATIEAVPGEPVTLSQGMALYRLGDDLDSLLKRRTRRSITDHRSKASAAGQSILTPGSTVTSV
jgi:hypothetical protein